MILNQAWLSRGTSRGRAHGETVASYMAALRQIPEYCDYKDSLTDMLRDRLVCGVNHQGIQRRLLAEKDLTYAKALELAKSMEAAGKGSLAMTTQDKPLTSNTGIHHTSQDSRKSQAGSQQPKGSSACYRCGEQHSPYTCCFRDQFCRKCNKQGHIAKVCRSTEGTKSQQGNGPTRSRGRVSGRYNRAPITQEYIIVSKTSHRL